MQNSGVNYKAKYMDLRARFIKALDLSFRQGFDAGYNKAQMENLQQQQQAAAQAGPQGAPQGAQAQPEQPSQDMGASPDQGGTELERAIAELEEAISKSEGDLKESLIHSLEHLKMAKNERPYSAAFANNLSHSDKAAVTQQEITLKNFFDKLEQEEKSTSRDIANIITEESLKKV